jgi:DNA-binding NarL/FixJ family response regulator
MAELKKTVLMAHLDPEQEQIWLRALESQDLEVRSASAATDLVELLDSMHQAGSTIPDLVLVDSGLKAPDSQTLQSSSVCQWSAKNYPDLKVVLFNPRQDKIKSIEQSWAIRRGAADVLPRLTHKNLVTSVAKIAALMGTVLAPSSLEAIANSLGESTPETQPATYVNPVDNASNDSNQPESEPEVEYYEPAPRRRRKPKDSGLIYRGVKIKK